MTDPYDYPDAIQLVQKEKLKGISIRTDHLDRTFQTPPLVDLSLLAQIPFLESFGVTPDLPVKRLIEFEGIYHLSNLKFLAIHQYPRLDLSPFGQLEQLFLRDSKHAIHLEKLTRLKSARIWNFQRNDVSSLAKIPSLSELWLSQAASKQLGGLESLPALSKLSVLYCRKLELIPALPKTLTKLVIEKCSKLKDLSFLKGHPSLEFLSVDVVDSLDFLDSLPRLSYIAFQNVLDGNLTPIAESKTLHKVGFYPQRRHYTHTEEELNKILSTNGS